jgi:hypothetical protein
MPANLVRARAMMFIHRAIPERNGDVSSGWVCSVAGGSDELAAGALWSIGR